MAIYQLEDLPMELIHYLFNYFYADEIFHSFLNINSHINAILSNYLNYRINLKSISRTNFDLVCQYVQPKQAIALALSNDEDTPGIIDLFLSRFQIAQFTRLQSLKLIEIGPEYWMEIFSSVTELKHLRSFRIFPSDRSDSWICNINPDAVTELDKAVFNNYAPILPQLRHLRLCHGDFLETIHFPQLRHLILERSTERITKHISSVAPLLKSLEISETIFINDLTTELIYPLPQLNRLVLRLYHNYFSMNDIERLLANVSQLKHFEIIADCNNDVVNGERWQIQLKKLNTFNFKFYLSYKITSDDLASFRTPFWIEEKRWFVAYTHGDFYSIPYFFTPTANENFKLPQYTTAPNAQMFLDHIEELYLFNNSNNFPYRFNHTRTLILSASVSLSTMDKLVNLDSIQCLGFSFGINDLPIKPIINAMLNLQQLIIRLDTRNILKNLDGEILTNIQTLEMYGSQKNTQHCSIEQLASIFPNVRHLRIKKLCSAPEILAHITRFKHLITASFRYVSSRHNSDIAFQRLMFTQSSLDRIRRSHKLSFKYRFDTESVHLWI